MQHSLNFDNLDEKLAQDEAEHRHAESKLTIEDNIEQEPNVKIVESTAGNKGGTSTKKLADTDKSATELKDNATGVQRKPLSEIHTDEKRFQGRDKLNEQVVNDIAENFSDADQDPIHIWKDPKDGKYYVLSGHHRYYGAKKAGRTDIKIQDRTGDFTEAQAIKFATEEANANRSMETPLERAKTLRKKREKGDSKEDIQKFLNKEGKNKNYVENLSHLNPNGKAIASLNALENSGDKVTQKEAEKIADWIGEARKQNKNLTDQHENELFDFLMNKNSSKRITTKAELISKIASLTNTLDFDPSKPLNIERYKYKSEGEKLYEEEVEKHKNKISELQQKINDINDRFK
ncbi:MAG TPA: ParB/RepB/Spo0J family partition protein, partial [Chitinophagales bacterium]|nr:ParB/RepB/Spo0J family partition protein [Chitinophagales bacterium]